MILPSRNFQDPISAFQIKQLMNDLMILFINLPIFTGNGSPEGVTVAAVGSLYLNLSGGAGTTLYVKESGGQTASGWVGK